jgi:hypothetical protein
MLALKDGEPQLYSQDTSPGLGSIQVYSSLRVLKDNLHISVQRASELTKRFVWGGAAQTGRYGGDGLR